MSILDFEYLVGRSEYCDFPDDHKWGAEVVAVTGAGGSIGSALAETLAQRMPRLLLLLDWCELGLTLCVKQLTEKHPDVRVVSILANVTDAIAVTEAFTQNPPTVVFHAAAYKHISVLESNVRAAVINNVFATKTLLACAVAANTRRFIFISTDKAADPVSILGSTKRICELLVAQASRTHPITTVSLRFANVLGSSGSVYRIFESQLEANKPLTVTDPRTSRYFVSIQEAVGFALWSADVEERGNVYTLYPGDEVRIFTLAERMLMARGHAMLTGQAITCSSMGKGERLHEVVCGAEERLLPTSVPFIFKLETPEPPISLDIGVSTLIAACKEGTAEVIKYGLHRLVPTLALHDTPYK